LNGLGTAIFQSAARGHDGILIEGYKTNLRWSVIVFLGAFLCGAYYLFLGNFVIGLGILIGGCFSPFLTGTNLYSAYLSGKRDFARQAVYADIYSNAFPVACLIVTALLTKSTLILLIVYFLSNTAINFVLYFRTLSIYNKYDGESDPGLLTYAKHQSILGILSTIVGNADQLLLFHFAGAAELAIYNFAVGVLDQSKGPLKTLDAMLQARFANRTTKDIASGMRIKMLLLAVASILIVSSYILLAPYIYKILFPNYQASVIYSQVYALSLLGMAWSPAGSYLTAKKRVLSQYISTIINSVFQILVLFIGIVYAGLWGLIFARIIIRFTGTWFNYALYLYEKHIAPPSD
jgi:O-antigen/teichoic acid export membrane protein